MCLALLLTARYSLAVVSDWKANPEGQVRLIAAHNRVASTGELHLGMEFKTAPGWYVYWKVPGDAGFPPSVKWQGSEGIKDFKWEWPAPTTFVLPGHIIEHGYEGNVVYPIRAQLSATKKNVHVSALISYLTCNTACVPYKYTFMLDIPVGPVEKDRESSALIDAALQNVPAPSLTDDQILKMAPTRVKNPMPDQAPAATPLSVLTIFLLAFLGGLILNVMPCVLPVLSIKLLGLLQQSGHAHRHIVRNALLSAAGIVVSFLVLATVTVIANAGGRAVGWGIQFQSPAFVLVLALIISLFALNLWGVFEIGIPRVFGHFAVTYGQHETPMAHFMSGLFAAVMATPCSAPFLGTAMGFALTQPAPTVYAAFGMAGIGMALPYFILAAFPGSLNWLPKPGSWMVRLKIVFGFFLAGTAGWLLWVFVHQVHPVEQAPFDEAQILALVQAGKPVLVDVTADWCVTCKYNERFILGSYDVKRVMEKKGIVLMRADWTNRNETIRLYLAKYGRSGIPFYAYYEPGHDPVLLSEFLTKPQVLNALGEK